MFQFQLQCKFQLHVQFQCRFRMQFHAKYYKFHAKQNWQDAVMWVQYVGGICMDGSTEAKPGLA